MKVLIPVLLFCTILLYVPFQILEKRKADPDQNNRLGTQITYVEKYTDSIGHLLLGDIVLFNTTPPHFAHVGPQVDGIIRSLEVTQDSTISSSRDEFRLRKAFHYNELKFEPTTRVINPNIDNKLKRGEVIGVFRKTKTNFYYSPIFLGGVSFILFFFFFFAISAISSMPDNKQGIAILMCVILGLMGVLFLTNHSSTLQYAYGNWKERLAYWGNTIFILIVSMQVIYRATKGIKNQYTQEALKFGAICIFAFFSMTISFKLIEWVYPDITLLAMYDNSELDDLTLWSQYYYGYTFAFTNLLFFGITKYRNMKTAKQTAITTQLNTTAQLNSLQARLNPHFLYNSLNSIASLIKTNPEKAEEMTINVSNFMRHFSNRKMEHLTSVSEEVSMIKEYLEIEKIRFEDKLRYAIKVSPDIMDQAIPRSLLQPLVENAIKYGYNNITKTIDVAISITQELSNLIIAVHDKGIDFDDSLDKGYGLSSVYDKLSLLYGEDYDISFHNHPDKHILISIQTDKLRIND